MRRASEAVVGWVAWRLVTLHTPGLTHQTACTCPPPSAQSGRLHGDGHFRYRQLARLTRSGTRAVGSQNSHPHLAFYFRASHYLSTADLRIPPHQATQSPNLPSFWLLHQIIHCATLRPECTRGRRMREGSPSQTGPIRVERMGKTRFASYGCPGLFSGAGLHCGSRVCLSCQPRDQGRACLEF